MVRNQADMVLRLVAQDQGVRKALDELGPKGQKALRQIDRAAKKARPGLKAVDNVMLDIKSSADGMLNRLGPAGSALRGIGPVGVTAGAGIAALVAVMIKLADAGERFVMTAAEIGRTAERLELDPEQFQALRLEMERLGVATSQTDSAFATAQKTLSEATLGTGEFYSAVKQINPELVRQVQLADTTSERLALIGKAFREASGETERNTLLVRTFGDGNVDAGLKILQMEKSLDELTGGMRDQGAIISAELLPKYEKMAQEITANEQAVEAAMLRLTSRFADLGLTVSQLKANTADLLVGLLPPRDLDEEIVNLTKKVERLNEAASGFGGDNFFLGNFAARAQKAQAELDELIRLRRQEAEQTFTESLGFQPEAAEPVPGGKTARPDPDAIKAQNELIAARQKAARVLAELGDISGIVAQKERELDALVKAGVLSRDEKTAALARYTETVRSQTEAARAAAEAESRAAEIRLTLMTDEERILAQLATRRAELNTVMAQSDLTQAEVNDSLSRYEDELRGVKAAKDELASALIATLDPMERLARDLEELERKQQLVNLSAKDYNKIVDERKRLATEETERDRFGETLAEAEKRIRAAGLSAEAVIEAKVEAERAVLDALGDRVSDVDVDTYLKEFEADLRQASEAGREFRGVNDLIQDALAGNIRSFEDFGEAALSILGDVIAKALEGSDALGGLFGQGGLGASIGSIFANVFHDGTHNPTRSRRTRTLSSARRLGSDESLAVLRRGERVFSVSDNRALIRAIQSPIDLQIAEMTQPKPAIPEHPMARVLPAAPAPQTAMEQPVNVTIINASGERVEQEERRNAKGERELLIKVGQIARGETQRYLSSPAGRNQMRATYGLTQTTLGRKRR